MSSSNPIVSISNHADFQIPVFFPDDIKSSYLSQLKRHFKRIENFLNSCDARNFEPSIKSDIVHRITNIQNSIIDVFKAYLDGHPSKAYSIFKDMLEIYQLREEINSLQQHKVNKSSFLFRIQEQYGKIPLKYSKKSGFLNYKMPADLFHPPFQRRRSVGTNRFSISGYPCLYLSESLLTSYSECFPEKKKTEKNMFHAICFKNLRPLYFIDLSDNKLKPDPKLFSGILPKGAHPVDTTDALDHLGVYQLILASHTKIKYKPTYKEEKYYFKAEYIIPQLLLQWLKQEGYAIDGIRYRSCTGTKRFPGKACHYNYVLPVQSNLTRGFCPTLASLFIPSKLYNHLSKKKIKNVSLFLKNVSLQLKKTDFRFSKSIVFK
jgi:hypothetical protein